MQIILLEKVAKLGNLGDVVKVKDGYARNFLIPTRAARRATEAAIKEFEVKRAELEKAAAEKLATAQALAEKMSGRTVHITQKAGVDGRLFGSVTNHDIAEALTRIDFKVAKAQVRMPNGPLKTVGEHSVTVARTPTWWWKSRWWCWAKRPDSPRAAPRPGCGRNPLNGAGIAAPFCFGAAGMSPGVVRCGSPEFPQGCAQGGSASRPIITGCLPSSPPTTCLPPTAVTTRSRGCASRRTRSSRAECARWPAARQQRLGPRRRPADRQRLLPLRAPPDLRRLSAR